MALQATDFPLQLLERAVTQISRSSFGARSDTTSAAVEQKQVNASCSDRPVFCFDQFIDEHVLL